MRETMSDERHAFDKLAFKKAVNIFCDVPCAICKKTLYPQQRCNLNTTQLAPLIPLDLVELRSVVVCSRCATNLQKQKVPPQAFWNKMEISNVISNHIKIIKVHNRFSQDWFKGQMILFAQG